MICTTYNVPSASTTAMHCYTETIELAYEWLAWLHLQLADCFCDCNADEATCITNSILTKRTIVKPIAILTNPMHTSAYYAYYIYNLLPVFSFAMLTKRANGVTGIRIQASVFYLQPADFCHDCDPGKPYDCLTWWFSNLPPADCFYDCDAMLHGDIWASARMISLITFTTCRRLLRLRFWQTVCIQALALFITFATCRLLLRLQCWRSVRMVQLDCDYKLITASTTAMLTKRTNEKHTDAWLHAQLADCFCDCNIDKPYE